MANSTATPTRVRTRKVSVGDLTFEVPAGTTYQSLSKRDLRKLFTLVNRGTVSRSAIDAAFGVPQWRGQGIVRAWKFRGVS